MSKPSQKKKAVAPADKLVENPYKVRGNKAFQDKEYDVAIEQYTIAIDDDQANHILYSNRSAAYAAKKEFADALVDADLCVAREPKWAKGHFRRGLALEGLERFSDAFAAYEAGLLIEPADPLLLKSRADLSVMLEEMRATGSEIAAAAQNPQHDRFSRLLAWLKEGKSKFPKLYLQYYSDEYRGVHCAARIPEDEVVLEVPLSHIMTSDVARVSDIGKLVCAAERNGLELRSKHTLLASYLLQEKAKGEASYWAPYLVTLPQQFKNMPIFFPPEDLAWLKGSMCIEKILERQDSLHLEYDNVCAAVPEFSRFSYEEFVWARLVVITRIFGLTIKGDKTDGLVPMADMLNHRRPRETKWTFDDSRNAFTITSLKALQRGDQVFDSYGQKCNSRFLVNYGFALEENEMDNEVIFGLQMARSDLLYDMKLRYLGGQPRSAVRDFQITINYHEKKTRDAFGFLRFALAKDAEMVMATGHRGDHFRAEDVDPLSITNEQDVLRTLKLVAQRVMDGFETTIAEDDALLKDPTLTMNQRNCVIVRRGEKHVAAYYIALADMCLPLLQQSWLQLKKVAVQINERREEGRFDPYIANVVIPLVRMQR